MAPINYSRYEADVTAVRADFQVVPADTPINSVLVAQLPAGVTLAIKLGTKQYIPNLAEGDSLEFGDCDDERGGLFILTTGVSATPLILIVTPAPGLTVN